MVDYRTSYVDGYVAQADEIAPLLAFLYSVKEWDMEDEEERPSTIKAIKDKGWDVDEKLFHELM